MTQTGQSNNQDLRIKTFQAAPCRTAAAAASVESAGRGAGQDQVPQARG
jgi:hypothetical protein